MGHIEQQLSMYARRQRDGESPEALGFAKHVSTFHTYLQTIRSEGALATGAAVSRACVLTLCACPCLPHTVFCCFSCLGYVLPTGIGDVYCLSVLIYVSLVLSTTLVLRVLLQLQRPCCHQRGSCFGSSQ